MKLKCGDYVISKHYTFNPRTIARIVAVYGGGYSADGFNLSESRIIPGLKLEHFRKIELSALELSLLGFR